MTLEEENSYLAVCREGMDAVELKKMAIGIIKHFLVFDPGEEFFDGILDGAFVCAVKPENNASPEDNAEIKLWLNPVLGLMIETKKLSQIDLASFFWKAARKSAGV